MGRWLRNTILSVLIGGGFLWLAVSDWNWDDIGDCFRPLPQGPGWLTVDLSTPTEVPERLGLHRDGVEVLTLTLAPGPAGRRSLPLALAPGSPPEGWWSVDTQAPLSAWSLDFRSPQDRALRDRPGDPWVFAAPSGGRARVRGIAWGWVLPYLGAFLFIHAARILRFGVLLRPLARLSLWRLTVVSSVGYMAIIALPLRLGEFVRPYLVTEDGITFSGALGACVVELVLDGLAVCSILFGSVFIVAAAGVTIPPGLWLAGGLAAGLFTSTLGVLLLARWRRAGTLGVLRRLGEPISKPLTDKVLALVDGFLEGVGALPNRRLVVSLFTLTAVYWGANIAGHWFLLQAAGVVGPDGQDLGLVQAAAVMSVLAIGIILPAGPGFAGNFEAAARLGLGLFVATEILLTRGAAWTLMLHSLTLVLQAGIGLAFLATGQVSLGRALAADPYAQAEQTP